MAERGSGNVFEIVSMRKRVAEEELTSIKDTKRRVQQFLTSYSKTWPFISASRKGNSYAYFKPQGLVSLLTIYRRTCTI
jgi:hypothetical protein